MAEVIVWFLFALGIITVIGHAIWWTLATIFRAVFGSSPEPAKPISLSKECVECGASLKLGDEFCHVCGRSQKPVDKPDPLADLAMTARQMDRFLNLAKIDVATHKVVMKAIEEERERLTQPMRPQQPVKPAVETPPVEPVVKPEPVVVARPIAPAPKPQAPEPVFAVQHREAVEPSKPEPAPEPRRSFAEMLETFMEESSIRWGEIIGGLLIIGCSLALVISLWSQITAVPLLKFSVFVGVTAGLFGIGFYSAFRWKLPTTSRGALTISTLLVPLNFLAMTAFSHSPIIVAGELIALMLFMFLVYQAAKVIAPGKSVVSNPWLMTGVTLLPSAAMLMAKHWQSRQAAMVWLGVAPMVCYWLGTGAALRGARAETGEEFDHKSNRVFLILGVATFAAVLPIGLFLAKAGVFSVTLHAFAPFITLFAVPAIACGMVFRQSAEASGKTKTIAASIALFGAMLAMSGLALTWPRPLPMIGTALINCAICAVIARSFDLKPAHVAAIAFFVLAYLLGASVIFSGLPDWIQDDNSRLIASFWTRSTGLGWLTLFVLFGVSAELWRRVGRKTDSRLYDIAAIVSASFSLLLLSLHGFGRAGDPQHLTLAYLFFAASAFVVAWFRDQFVAGWIGLALAQLAIVQAFAFKFGYQLAPYHPVRLSLLTLASVATIAAFSLRNSGEKARRVFAAPATFAALVASVAATPFVLFGGWMSVGQMTGRVFWLAAIWLTLSLVNNWRILFTAFQAALTVGVVCGVLAMFDAHALPSALAWENPVRWQAVGIALALLSLCWIALRLKVRSVARKMRGTIFQIVPPEENASSAEQTAGNPMTNFERLFFPPWPTVDRMVTAAVWLLLIVLSLADKAYGLGSWLLLLALSLVFVVGLWEQFQRRLVLAMMTLLACACVLLAGRFGAEGLTVQWFRWSAAISFVLVGLLVIFRDQLRQFCQQFNWPQMETRSAGLAELVRAESLALFAMPVLVLTVVRFVLALLGANLPLESTLLFLAPVFIVSLTLAAHAARERSAVYAFASGLLLNLSATLACLSNPEVRLVTVVQANVIVSALVSLAWLAVRRRLRWDNFPNYPTMVESRPGWENDERDNLENCPTPIRSTPIRSAPAPGLILRTQVAVTLVVSLALLALADARIALDPAISSQMVAAIGNGWGWLAVSLSAAAWLSLRRQLFDSGFAKLSFNHFGFALLAAVSLIVCSLSRWLDGWASYHALMIGVGASAWLMFAVRGRVFKQQETEAEDTADLWATCLGLAQFGLTLRGMEAPNSIWWTTASLAALSLLFGWMAVALRSRAYVYLSAPLLNLIASLLFARRFNAIDHFEAFLAVNVMVMSLASLVWLGLDLKLMRQAKGSRPFHRQTIFLLLPAVLWLAGFHWVIWWGWSGHVETVWANWAAMAAVAALLFARLWDNSTLPSLRGLHLLGGAVILETCCLLPIANHGLLATTAAAFSLYVLATGWLWRKREWLSRLAAGSRIPEISGTAELMRSWLLSWGFVQTAFVMMIGLMIVFDSESLKTRLLATTAAFVLPIGFALFVRGGQDQRLITACVRLGLLNLVMWSWAWLTPPSLEGGWQITNRFIIVMLIAEAVLIGYRLVVMRRLEVESLWRKSLRADLPVVAGVGLAVLALVLAAEFEQRASFGAVLLGWPAIVAVLVTLIGVSLSGIAFAVLPGEDPFDLDERGKMRYVYLSEVFLVLTFVHLRLTMPWLFGGVFTAYWPIVVMLLAFAGVALSEVFRRQGKLVLAEPLAKTGVLLPLLPVIGFWSLNSQVPYSGLLLTVGLFYGVLSVMKRSLGFGLLAALAGNSGLWHLLNRVDGLAFFEHPQLWLIPAAVSVLLAARINRESLTADQMNSIRYGAMVTIYVSSTADIFINGVDDAPWLPIILAVLAVAGVAAGLMLRIRAFLFLGTAFLLLSMLTMIWSASVNLRWTWLWYVTGIAFGVLIIYTVAMFERKREQMIGFVERLKQWQ